MTKSTAISHRYDIFISAFEKRVSEYQKQIKRMDHLHKPYEIVRLALERSKLPNSVTLELEPSNINITIVPTDNDALGAFDSLISDIGTNLVAAKLHTDGQPAFENTNYALVYTWRIPNPHNDGTKDTISLGIDVPWNGTRYFKITTTSEPITVQRHKRTLTWLPINQPTNEPIDQPVNQPTNGEL